MLGNLPRPESVFFPFMESTVPSSLLCTSIPSSTTKSRFSLVRLRAQARFHTGPDSWGPQVPAPLSEGTPAAACLGPSPWEDGVNSPEPQPWARRDAPSTWKKPGPNHRQKWISKNFRRHTPSPSHDFIPPSSPRARCTRSLTFVQETCHIEGIFKEYLKEGTEGGGSEITSWVLSLGHWQRGMKGSLFNPHSQRVWVCESWGPNTGSPLGDLPGRPQESQLPVLPLAKPWDLRHVTSFLESSSVKGITAAPTSRGCCGNSR